MARGLLSRMRGRPRPDGSVRAIHLSRWFRCFALLVFALAGCARPIPAQWQAVPPLPRVPYEKAWPVLVSTVTDKYPIETSDPVAGYIRSGWIVLDTCWHGLIAGGRQPCLQARSEVRVLQKDPLQLQIRVNLLKKPSPVMGVQRDWLSAGNNPKMEGDLRAEFIRRLEALRISPGPGVSSPPVSAVPPTQIPPLPSTESSQTGVSQGSSTSRSSPQVRSDERLLVKGLRATRQAVKGEPGTSAWTLAGTIVNPTSRAASQASLIAVFLDQAETEVHRDQQAFPLTQAALESAFAWKVNAVPQTASKVKVRVVGVTWAGGGGK